MTEPLLCMNCVHWQGLITSYSAGCRLKVYTGLIPFDRADPPCAQHSALVKPAPTMPPQMPAIVQMFVPTGAKQP